MLQVSALSFQRVTRYAWRTDRQTDRMTDSTTTVCRGSAPRHNNSREVHFIGRPYPKRPYRHTVSREQCSSGCGLLQINMYTLSTRAQRFHLRCGKKISLSYDNTVAERVGYYCNNGIVFTEQPIALGTKFRVKILEYVASKWSGSIASTVPELRGRVPFVDVVFVMLRFTSVTSRRQSLLAVRVWQLENFAGAAKNELVFRPQICGLCRLFSRVWYACSDKDLWIQLANVSAQDRTERCFDTTLRS